MNTPSTLWKISKGVLFWRPLLTVNTPESFPENTLQNRAVFGLYYSNFHPELNIFLFPPLIMQQSQDLHHYFMQLNLVTLQPSSSSTENLLAQPRCKYWHGPE